MKSFVLLHAIMLMCIAGFCQNFGIDQPNPTEKLDVNGNIRSSTLTGNNIHLAVNPNVVLTKLCYAYTSGYNQPDGTDVGYVAYRDLTFTKQQANTNVRISYTDNLRTYNCCGGGYSCRWRFIIDGGNCPSGVLAYDFYANIAGQNLHRSRTLVGMCGGVGAGTHTLRIYVENSPGYSGSDCYTGWQGSWLLEVQEVY